MMGVDMTASEYEKLWYQFDPHGNGCIRYHEWNNVVGNLIHPLSDISLDRPDTPKVKEVTRRSVARGLLAQVKDVELAFREIDSDSSGYISHQEFIQLLMRLKVPMGDDEETFHLFKKYQSSSNKTGQMNLEDFKAFAAACTGDPASLAYVRTELDAMAPASIPALEKLMATKLFSKYSTVQRAFRNMDADKSGDLSYKEFRQAFEFMCMPLKDYQFDAMVARFDPSGKGVIKYDDFNRVIGPLIHPEARDSSRAMQSIEETSGAQSGLVFHPGAKLGGNVPFAVRTARLAAEAQLLGAKAKPQAPAFGTYSVLSGSSSSGRAQVEAFPEPEEEAAQQEGQQAQASGSSAAAAASSSSSSSSSSSAAAPAAAAPVDVAKLEEQAARRTALPMAPLAAAAVRRT
jgi:Ca2+-binding EF-hand superfamily protein